MRFPGLMPGFLLGIIVATVAIYVAATQYEKRRKIPPNLVVIEGKKGK